MSINNNNITKLKGTNIGFDFDTIKENLKSFLSGQSEFSDYDFESSGLNILLDVLANNSQMLAMIAHLGLNESFLSSAQARANVVSLAKQLGYTPTSVSCALATIDVTVVPPELYNNNTAFLPQYTKFSSFGLDWYTTSQHTSTRNAQGNFVFDGVTLRQGVRKIIRYYFDEKNQYAKFEIPDRDVDITTLKVRVKQSESTTFFTTYNEFTTFSAIDETSPVYFLEENSLGLYEIYFTGSNLGISPSDGNLIELEYFYSVGASANNISNFTLSDTIISNLEKVYITTVTPARGGGDKETIESIRFNAPHFFEAQNRCVTYKDFAAIIKKEFPQTESINVWGGENTTPAEYGRVYICVKPKDSDALSQTSKDFILNNILSGKRITTITPKLVDPEYTQIGLDIVVRYNETQTTNTPQDIINIIRNNIITFENTFLKSFDGVFRHSQLIRAIDSSEFSIQSSTIRTYLLKNITLSSSFDNDFEIYVPSEFYDYDDDNIFIKSSNMVINGRIHYLTDKQDINDGNKRQLILISIGSQGKQIIENVDIGYIDIQTQRIYIYGFRPDTDTQLKIYINPKSSDVVPMQNQLLRFDHNEIKIEVEPDYFSSQNSLSSSRFNTTNKNAIFFE
jgi:hypothetical protein